MSEDSRPDRRVLSAADRPALLDSAEALRRRFEADPAGAVAGQVSRKLAELRGGGLPFSPRLEGEVRQRMLRHSQLAAGIENPRHLSNQNRAELARDFRRGDRAGRISLLTGLEAAHGAAWQEVAGEMVDALPPSERAAARRFVESVDESLQTGVEPQLGAELTELPEDLGAEPDAAQPVAETPAARDVAEVDDDGDPSDTVMTGEGILYRWHWDGPAFPANERRRLVGYIDRILAAREHEVDEVIAGIGAELDPESEFVKILADLALERFIDRDRPTGLAGASYRGRAETELGDLRALILSGRDYDEERQADREAFAKAEAVAGLNLVLLEDGRIAFGKPGEDPLFTVDWYLARALARDPEVLREGLARLDALLTSEASVRDLTAQIDLAFGFASEVDIETPNTDDQDTRNAILAANAAYRSGEDPQALRAGLIGTFFPDLHKDPIAWGQLLLEMLPLVGDVIAIRDGIQGIGEMRAALAQGDIKGAVGAGLTAALDLAVVVPAFGPLFKAAKTGAKRALYSRTGARLVRRYDPLGLHSRYLLRKSRDESLAPKSKDKKGQETAEDKNKKKDDPRFGEKPRRAEVFGHLLKSNQLTVDQKKLLRGLWPHLLGRAPEEDFRRLLQRAGFKVIDDPDATRLDLPREKKADGKLEDQKHARYDAVVDGHARGGLNILLNSFILPKWGERATLFEFKLGNARARPTQLRGAKLLNDTPGVDSMMTRGGVSAEAVEFLRYDFADLPEDFLEETVRKLLNDHVDGTRSTRLGQVEADLIVDAFLDYHRTVRKGKAGEMPTVGEAFAALGAMVALRAESYYIETKGGETGSS